MFNKKFGGWANGLMGMLQAALPDADVGIKPKGWQGLPGRKFTPCYAVASYPEGAAGNTARNRVIRRAQRWVRANPGATMKAMPRHIRANLKVATS